MKLRKKLALIAAAIVMICPMLTACSTTTEDTGLAYEEGMVISGADDLVGKIVAVQLRSEADSFVEDNELTDYVMRYEDMSDAVTALLEQSVAALVVDANYAQQIVSDSDGLKIVDGSIGSVDYSFAALRENEGEATVALLNAAIAELNTQGELDNLISSKLAGKDVELTLGSSSSSESDEEAERKLTFVADAHFKPFIYTDDSGSCVGFFASIASESAELLGCSSQVIQAEAGAALEELSQYENSFAVISGELSEEDAEIYAVTDVFYTSQLVIVVRADD